MKIFYPFIVVVVVVVVVVVLHFAPDKQPQSQLAESGQLLQAACVISIGPPAELSESQLLEGSQTIDQTFGAAPRKSFTLLPVPRPPLPAPPPPTTRARVCQYKSHQARAAHAQTTQELACRPRWGRASGELEAVMPPQPPYASSKHSPADWPTNIITAAAAAAI